MSGDKFDIYGKSYYVTNNTGTAANNSPINPLDILTGLLGGPMGSTNTAIHGEVTSSQLNGVPAGISAINAFLGNQTNTNNETPTKPKAFINYVLFDDQFKCVGSGFAPVGANSVLTDYAAVSAMHNIPVIKNGFAYIYFSNESPVDVFFDNIQVVHTRGPILEETHYYPFGLTMAGISAKAAGKLGNWHNYNGKELQAKEFADGSGLQAYDYGARMQDPQLGRWWTIDPKVEKYNSITPYCYALNNPIKYIDPDGKDVKVSIDNDKKNITLSSTIYVTGKDVGRHIMEMATYLASNSDLFSGSYTDSEGQDWSMGMDITFQEGKTDDVKKVEDGVKSGKPTGDNIMEFQDSKVRSNVPGITLPAKTEFNSEKGIYTVISGAKSLTGFKAIMGGNDPYFSSASAGLHEIMHLFGLSDRYKNQTKFRKDGTTYTTSNPNQGFANDIMGKSYCNPISQTHWNNWGNYIMKNGTQSGDVINVIVDRNPDGTLK